MNSVTLLGRLAKNVEFSTTDKTSYARLTLAVSRDRSDDADSIRCIAFGKLAEAVAHNCTKGRQLLVNGRLDVSKSNDKYYTTVICQRIEFLAKPKESTSVAVNDAF